MDLSNLLVHKDPEVRELARKYKELDDLITGDSAKRLFISLSKATDSLADALDNGNLTLENEFYKAVITMAEKGGKMFESFKIGKALVFGEEEEGAKGRAKKTTNVPV